MPWGLMRQGPPHQAGNTGNSAEPAASHQHFPPQRVSYKYRATFSECEGLSESWDAEWGVLKSVGAFTPQTQRRGLSVRQVETRGKQCTFAKSRASHSVIAEDKMVVKAGEMVGSGKD